MRQYDFLIIGSGIAGLSYALKVAEQLPKAQVAIITKSDESESNTKYAQGGIAVVIDEIKDSYQKHIEDTLTAGDGLCDREVVEKVIKQGPKRFQELVEWGVNFDKEYAGNYSLGLEGGHSKHRILHHKDITGYEIEMALLEKIHQQQNVTLFSENLAVDLITNHHLDQKQNNHLQCYGAYVLNESTGKIDAFLSKITLLASGGIGQVYQNTTNPSIATGDGIAMAYRAKAKIRHMEFIQFHPTVLHNPTEATSFLISEAVRGEGALLKTKKGNSFMQYYDSRRELASRDIVSRAIDNELKKSGDDYVLLDCRSIPLEKFEKKFPNILRKVKKIGIDITKDMIPVVPAMHYLCGGIVVDQCGQTTVGNLFASGETACTGLHGANRLASNSLLEALVYSYSSFKQSIDMIDKISVLSSVPSWNDEGTVQPNERILITHTKKELNALMSNYVAIVRSDERLERAYNKLDVLFKETESLYKKTKISNDLVELRNMITVAYLIVTQSLARKNNVGVFYKV